MFNNTQIQNFINIFLQSKPQTYALSFALKLVCCKTCLYCLHYF